MSRGHRVMGVNAGRYRQAGISLVEALVTLLVGLVLLGGVIAVYLGSQQSYNAAEQLSRIQESGRFAMDQITRDLRRSGFWGGNADLTTNAGTPGPIDPGHECDADNRWGRMIEWRVSGRNNTNDGYDCATGYVDGSEILTVRYADPDNEIPFADFVGIPADARLYLRSTMFRGWVMTGAQKDAAGNSPSPDVPGSPVHLDPVVRPLVSHAYFIANSGRTCGTGDAIPTLSRVSLDPLTGNPRVEEVASGVEQLQVRYLLGDTYVDADAVADTEWPDVSAVRVWLLVRSECPEPDFVNETTYAMGDIEVPDAPDGFRRQLYVSTVMLRNTAVR